MGLSAKINHYKFRTAASRRPLLDCLKVYFFLSLPNNFGLIAIFAIGELQDDRTLSKHTIYKHYRSKSRTQLCKICSKMFRGSHSQTNGNIDNNPLNLVK